MRNELRDQLRDVLLSGDDEALRRLAREAVNGLGRAEAASPAGSRGSPTACCAR